MWFDYLHLSDVERDERFAEDYLVAYRDRYARRTDVVRARFVNPVSRKNKRAWTCISKARAAADSHSIPYDYWSRYALAISDESLWPVLAQPSHLYSEAMQALIVDRWETHTRYKLVLPENPQAALPQYQDYLKQTVESFQNPHQAVYDMLSRRQLDWSLAEHLFSPDILCRVRDMELTCGPIR